MEARKMSELLQVMIDNFDEYFNTGLCWTYLMLWGSNIITYEEYDLLEQYIQENRPNKNLGWSWRQGAKAPRLKWLKKQQKIELEKEKNNDNKTN